MGWVNVPERCARTRNDYATLLGWCQFSSWVLVMTAQTIRPSSGLSGVKYEIRGALARRAHEMERMGYDIVPLNIGNPGAFGFRAPETMRLAMIENLKISDAYSHQKGIFPAREAIVMLQQSRGVRGVTADDVFMGNGVSELIDLCLRGLLNTDDEVLVPSPDYPLWTAAVNLNRGRAVHYTCRPENGFVPDVKDIEAVITSRTRAIVVINPNNPTGAVYPRQTLEAIARLAEKHHLVVFADEIYDQIVYGNTPFVPMATLVHGALCVTMSGLSKVYRACGFRVGWAVFSGDMEHAKDYVSAVELLSSLRLCSNVPGQWAVQTALGGYQSIKDLIAPGGRLYETRQAVLDNVRKSKYLDVRQSNGAIYDFIRIKSEVLPDIDDRQFALDLLEHKHVLIAPGSSFNVPYKDHFRITHLPRAEVINDVFQRMEELFDSYASGSQPQSRPAPSLKVV